MLPDKKVSDKGLRGMAGAVTKAARGQDVSASEVIASVGGFRGIVEASAPGIVFLIVYSLTKAALLAAGWAVAAAAVILLVRIVRKENRSPGYSAFFGVVLCYIFVLFGGGDGRDYYIPGFITNAVYATVLVVSVIVGWPLLGVIAGFLTGGVLAWRRSPRLRRVGVWFTLIWAGVLLLRLAVQLPLFFAGQVEALGIARLVMGLPLYALLVFVTWKVCAAVFRAERDRSEPQVIVE